MPKAIQNNSEPRPHSSRMRTVSLPTLVFRRRLLGVSTGSEGRGVGPQVNKFEQVEQVTSDDHQMLQDLEFPGLVSN